MARRVLGTISPVDGRQSLLNMPRTAPVVGCSQVDHRTKEPAMFLPLSFPSRLIVGAIGAGAVAGALSCATASSTAAADTPPRPANCTAGDVAGVAAGVAASLSTYLFTHPDVNGFYTGLQDRPKDQIRDDVQNYFNANPQEQADLENIRQPLVDVKQRCQWTPLAGEAGATP
ncbi:hemophore-related protein [Mycobacterium sp. 852002-50816_SCH5313054-b]|uniref:hemophore-related protein n=1 Tax=Mycobacterium sp. 852002-50816_SCH5313054-b TaxID=1834092 RepID=UPI0035155DB0